MYPPYQNTGTPVPIGTLKPGDKFRHDGNPKQYTIFSLDPFQVKRADGWIVRPDNLDKIVYVDK